MNGSRPIAAIPGLSLLSGLRVVAANGLTGKYYNEYDFTSQKSSRTDAKVDFDWDTSIPADTALTSRGLFFGAVDGAD